MTTAVTSLGGRGPGSRSRDAALVPIGLRSRRVRVAAVVAVVVAVVVATCLVVLDDLGTRGAAGSARASEVAATARLGELKTALSRAHRGLAAARRSDGAVVQAFDADEAALSAAQTHLAGDDAGIWTQGVDLGRLETCLSDVEQAVNQLAVGRSGGGLQSLRESTTACAVLGQVG
jgi:hypothetical protein